MAVTWAERLGMKSHRTCCRTLLHTMESSVTVLEIWKRSLAARFSIIIQPSLFRLRNKSIFNIYTRPCDCFCVWNSLFWDHRFAELKTIKYLQHLWPAVLLNAWLGEQCVTMWCYNLKGNVHLLDEIVKTSEWVSAWAGWLACFGWVDG